jgi:hypothetical protein
MRRSLALAGVALFTLSAVQAGHHSKYDGTHESRLDRFAQRAPRPCLLPYPVDHMSMARAGYPQSVRKNAVPSVTDLYNGGYVGGRRVLHNNLAGRGPGSATGPIYTGVFAVDWTGFRQHMGRVFLAPSVDPSKGRYFYRGYWAEGPRLVDIGTIRPLRKAVLEARHDAEHGHGENGHNGHGDAHGDAHGEHGHSPEGGAKEGGN